MHFHTAFLGLGTLDTTSALCLGTILNNKIKYVIYTLIKIF